ncbi:MAG TPA: ATP-binding cassette domain-containing protein, partial [Acidimicrobiales bacterium]|nr:ATP-binding cassette domain-containing protein [Acidimicrobiales bacterium]
MTLIEELVATSTAISLRGVSKAFGHGAGAVLALDNITLDVARGEFVCLVGASGCGKSTSLNLIAGLDRPTVGDVSVNGRTALMFQEAALFPWLTVRDNVALPLRLAGVGKAQRRRRADELLEQVHLGG